ncbi:MAG TPA: hypothetical protein VFG23_09125 [Polyangia bacterium]|nr:hypothetical protein [Polyangia bacterium]
MIAEGPRRPRFIGAARVLAVAIAIAAATAPRAAAEAVPSGPEPSPPNHPATEIAVVGSPANLDWVRALVHPEASGAVHWSRADHFDPHDVLRSTAGAGGSILCWIDLTDARRARIYFAARSGERFLIRDLELSGGFDEIDRATLAEVLDLSLAALAEDGRAGLSRAETETLLARRNAALDAARHSAAVLATPASPAPSIVADSGPHVGVFYAGQAFSTGLPIVQGPGLLLAWPFGGSSDRPRGRLAGWLSVQYQLPADDQASLVGLRLQAVAPRAGVAIRWPRGLEARLGLGAELAHLTPLGGTAAIPVSLTAPRWSADPLVIAAVGAAVSLTRRVEIEALVFTDYLPTAVRYDLAVGGQRSPVLSSFRLRPGIALELAVR